MASPLFPGVWSEVQLMVSSLFPGVWSEVEPTASPLFPGSGSGELLRFGGWVRHGVV